MRADLVQGSLFDDLQTIPSSRLETLVDLLKTTGTTRAHKCAVNVDHENGVSYTSFRVSRDVKRIFERLRVGISDGDIWREYKRRRGKRKHDDDD